MNRRSTSKRKMIEKMFKCILEHIQFFLALSIKTMTVPWIGRLACSPGWPQTSTSCLHTKWWITKVYHSAWLQVPEFCYYRSHTALRPYLSTETRNSSFDVGTELFLGRGTPTTATLDLILLLGLFFFTKRILSEHVVMLLCAQGQEPLK